MKTKISKLFLMCLLFFIQINIANANTNLGKIMEYIKIEVDQYSTFPEQGWWQIESVLNKKYNVIIPNELLAEAQKFYVQLIIDKNINKFTTFDNLAKAHNFPRNMLNFAADYFKKAKERAKTSDRISVPAARIQRDQRTNTAEENNPNINLNDYNPYMSEYYKPPQIYLERLNTQQKLSETLQQQPAQQQRVFDENDIVKAQRTLNTLKTELTSQKNAINIPNVYNENQELDRLRETLDFALNTITKLNETIKQFISNVEARYDVTIKNTMQEYQKLLIQINATNKMIADIAQYYYNNLDDAAKRNLKNITIDDSRPPADNLVELNFIIREYQKTNSYLMELLKRHQTEIETLQKENKALQMRINIEYEKLLKENNELKKKLLLKTN